jgi:hypothetical protein
MSLGVSQDSSKNTQNKNFEPSTLKGLFLYPERAGGPRTSSILSGVNKLSPWKFRQLLNSFPSGVEYENRWMKLAETIMTSKILDDKHKYSFTICDPYASSNYHRTMLKDRERQMRRDHKYNTRDYEAQGLTESSNPLSEAIMEFLKQVGKDFSVSKAAMWAQISFNFVMIFTTPSNHARVNAMVNLALRAVEFSDLTAESLQSVDMQALNATIQRVQQSFKGESKLASFSDAPISPENLFFNGDAEDPLVGQSVMEDFHSIPEETMSMLMRVILTMYGFVFDTKVQTMDVLGSKWQDALNKAYRATSSLPELIAFFIKMLNSGFEWFQVNVLGVDPDYEKLISSFDAVYDTWIKELFDLEKVYDDPLIGVAINPACRKRVVDHHNRGQDLLLLAQQRKTTTANTIKYFQYLFEKSFKMNAMALSYSRTTKFRSPAYMFQFTGGSGVGKTTSLNRLAAQLNSDFNYGFEEGNLIYTRCQSSQYWEGYNSQMMTLYDDLFQNKDVNKRSSLAEEIIFVCNSSPVALDMAAVESKGKVVFSSKFIAVTTNIEKERSLNIACPEAFWRRFNSRWELSFPPEYVEKGVPNRKKMRENAPPEMSDTEVHFYFLRCKLIGTGEEFTFQDMSTYISEEARVHHTEQTDILRANEEFVAKHKGKRIPVGIMNADDALPTNLEYKTGKESIEVPVYATDMTDCEAQGFGDKGIFPALHHIGGRRVVLWLSWDDVCKLTRAGVTDFFSFIGRYKRTTSHTLQAQQAFQSSINRLNREEGGYGIGMIATGFCRLRNYWYGENTYYGIKIEHVRAALAILAIFSVSWAVKTKIDRMHWAFRDHEGQSCEKFDNFMNKKRNRQISKFDPAKGRSFTRGGYVAQAMEDDNYATNIYSNCSKIAVIIPGGKHVQRAIALTGGTYLCTVHFLKFLQNALEEYGKEVRLEVSSLNFSREIDATLVTWIQADASTGMDIAIIDFKNTIPAKRSIVNYFIAEKDVPETRLNNAIMVASRVNSRGVLIAESITLENARYVKESPPYKCDDDIYHPHRSFGYDNFSEKGLCGSIMIHKDSHVQGSIIGMHVAGSPTSGVGLSQLVTREIIQEMLCELGIEHRRVDFPPCEPISENLANKYANYDEIELLGQVDSTSGVRMAEESQLRESLVFNDFQVHKTEPALLKITDGISPMKNALAKAELTPGTFDQDILAEVSKEMDYMYASLDTYGYARTLSYKETLNGFPGSNHLNSIDLSTSSGYPYVLYRKQPGKKDLMDFVDMGGGEAIHYTKGFFRELKAEELKLQRGKVPFYIFTASLKDERRDIAKVVQGKTRMFSAGNAMLLVLCRRYYGGFIAFLTANSAKLGSKVGANLCGSDFAKIYAFCTAGVTKEESLHNWLHGDFSSYDISLSSMLIERFFIAACNWYERHKKYDPDFEQSQLVRKSLSKCFDGPVHIMGRVLLSFGKGNTSGNFATVHINGYINELTHRYIYYKLAQQHGTNPLSFSEHVKLVTYGDDSMGVVKDSVKEWYNGETIAPIYKKDFGMVYTNANKGTDLTLVGRNAVSFCKRKFYFHNDLNMVVGTMNVDDILEITNWIKECGDYEAATVGNIEAAESEMFLRGRSEYEFFLKKAQDICAKKKLSYTPISYGHRVRDFLEKSA